MNLRYSIQIKQNAISREAYEYLDNLKKMGENTGSLFDPQPSQLNGNIYCVNDPDKLVIGFISAGKSSDKRIFISHSELPDYFMKVH